jgi:hypothetical protein
MPFIIPLGEIDDKLPVGWKAMPSHAIRRPKTYRQKLKVKNCCSQCGKKWTSMRGLAEFKLGTSLSKATKYMSCQLYQQKCRRCDIYTEPDYYTEEFADLVMAVTRKFDDPRVVPVVRAKNGNPRGIHLDCEACELGIDH